METEGNDEASSAPNNDEAISAWNTVLFEKFCRFRYVLTTGLAAHGDEALGRLAAVAGARVIDIGCGFGDTSLQLASAVGTHGNVVGVDCASNFVDSAREDGRRASLANARFLVADVQTDDLGGPFDYAFSRFGTMFFTSPVAALRNVRRSLARNGMLIMVVWRQRQDNPWLYAAEQCVRALVPDLHDDRDAAAEPTCGPGPFSMASADTVSAQLLTAGYTHVTLERFDTEICIGRHLDEAISFAMALGPAGEIMRLAGAEGSRRAPEVMAALASTLARFERPEGVYAPSSSWIVSARAP